MAERKSGLPVDPTSSIFSQIISPLVPMSYQVDRPYSVNAQEVDGGYIYSETPMKVSNPQLDYPPILTGGIEFFKGLIENPTETASGIATAIGEELVEYPKRQIRTAEAGGETYNPETGEVERFDPFSVPATTALGTAASLAKVAPDGSVALGMLGGVRMTGGKDQIEMAKQLRKMGKSDEEVYRSTGVYFDEDVLGSPNMPGTARIFIPTKDVVFQPDAAMKKDVTYGTGEVFGLSDSIAGANITPQGTAVFTGDNLANLDEVINFPQLFEKYPQLRDVQVARLEPLEGDLPFELPQAFHIKANESSVGKPVIAIRDQQDSKKALSAILHEVQHEIQAIEGHYTGGSAIEIFNILEERYPDLEPAYLRQKSLDLYQGLYGEAEARTVQRMFENPDEQTEYALSVLRREAPANDVRADELDAVDALDEDDLLEEASMYDDEGIAPFAGLIGEGISESRQKKPRRFLTSQDLGGNKQGIMGLAHGVSYKDKYGEYLSIPEDTKNNFSLDFLESYPFKDGKYTIPKTDFVRQAGLDNELVQELTGKQATSSEIKRPGFSLSFDPIMSYRKFAGPTSIGDYSSIQGKENPYQQMTDLLVASPGLIPRTAVQDLSPAQYLLAAYDPAKPLTRKPNTAYTESEIHVGNAESRDISLRKPTAREQQDFLRIFEANEQAVENITAGLGAAVNALDHVTSKNDWSDFTRAFNQGIKNAVPSFDALQGADMNAYVDQEGLRLLANKIVGPQHGLHKADTSYQQKVKQALRMAHGTLGEDLYDAAERYTKNFYRTREEGFKNEVREESKKIFEYAVQNQLTGRNEDVSGFFRHGGTNPVSGGHIIEFEVPFEVRKRLDHYDMTLRVYEKAPNSISKKNLDLALESLKEVPSYKRFVYPDSEGVLQLRQNIPGVAKGDFSSAEAVVFNNVARRFEDLRTGKITLKAMEEIIDRSIPISFAEPFHQIAQNIDRVTQQYLDGINKSPKGAEFNQVFRDSRAARNEMVDILRQMNAANNDVNYMPKFRKALFDDRPSTGRSSEGQYRRDVRESYKPQVIGPRTGAKLYEKGGAVRAGIGEFIKYMQ